MQKADELKRNLLYNTIGNGIYFVCQWLITGFFIKRMSADGGLVNSGLLATAAAAVNIFLPLANYGMRTFQVSDTAGKYSNGDYLLSRVISTAAATLLCLLYSIVVGYDTQQTVCIMIYMLYKALEAATDVLHGAAQKFGRMDVVGISYAVRGVAGAAVFAATLYATQNVNTALLIMTAASWLFCAIYDLRVTKPYWQPAALSSRGAAWRLLLECLPLAVNVVLNTTIGSVPKLMLERIDGKVAIGIFNLVNSPVLVLQVGVSYMFAPFIGIFAQKLKDGDLRGMKKLAAGITLGILALGVAATLGVISPLGRWGLDFLYHDETVTAQSALLVPMVWCSVMTAIMLFYCTLLTVMRRVKALLVSNAVALAVSLLASSPLIRSFGMLGASLATLAAVGAACAVQMASAFMGLRSK